MYNVSLRSVRDVEKKYVLLILSMTVALVIQHAKCMRHIMLSSVASLAIQNFST
jgi:hypothetical protein